MANSYVPNLLTGAAVLASVACTPSAGHAADLSIREQPATCHTVFTGLPVPPYFTRHGCIDNVVTVQRLPEYRPGHMVVQERNLVIDPHAPDAVAVYK